MFMEVHGFRKKGSSILKKKIHGFLRIHAFKKEKKGKEVMGRTRWARFLFYKGDYLVFGPETYRGFHRLAVFESYDGRYR